MFFLSRTVAKSEDTTTTRCLFKQHVRAGSEIHGLEKFQP